jgi:hypothetical protein
MYKFDLNLLEINPHMARSNFLLSPEESKSTDKYQVKS